jgi:hypothetical protein
MGWFLRRHPLLACDKLPFMIGLLCILVLCAVAPWPLLTICCPNILPCTCFRVHKGTQVRCGNKELLFQ